MAPTEPQIWEDFCDFFQGSALTSGVSPPPRPHGTSSETGPPSPVSPQMCFLKAEVQLVINTPGQRSHLSWGRKAADAPSAWHGVPLPASWLSCACASYPTSIISKVFCTLPRWSLPSAHCSDENTDPPAVRDEKATWQAVLQAGQCSAVWNLCLHPPPLAEGGSTRTVGFFQAQVQLANVHTTCNPIDTILGSRRSPGEGNGNPLQCCSLENPLDGGAWRATVRGVTMVVHDLVINPSPRHI